MMQFPKSLSKKLENRIENRSFRQLSSENNLIDFASNDYLGYAKSEIIFDQAHQLLINKNIKTNGATGSRLPGRLRSRWPTSSTSSAGLTRC